MPTVYTQPKSPGHEEHQLVQSYLMETLPTLGMEWQISFDFRPTLYYNKTEFTNILHLTIGGDTSTIGDRIPAIFYHPNRGLIVATAIGDNANHAYHAETPTIPPAAKWTTIVVSQLKSGPSTSFSVTINGTALFAPMDNPRPQGFSAVKVYASNPWFTTQPGTIRRLTIKTQ